eukprot:m.486721 g.486721  ORF g.486721 m.486721 type:complete len:219 (+) comp24560_c0_seq1:127-783(+)
MAAAENTLPRGVEPVTVPEENIRVVEELFGTGNVWWEFPEGTYVRNVPEESVRVELQPTIGDYLAASSGTVKFEAAVVQSRYESGINGFAVGITKSGANVPISGTKNDIFPVAHGGCGAWYDGMVTHNNSNTSAFTHLQPCQAGSPARKCATQWRLGFIINDVDHTIVFTKNGEPCTPPYPVAEDLSEFAVIVYQSKNTVQLLGEGPDLPIKSAAKTA